MLTLRNLLMASAIAVSATAAVAQTSAPDPSTDTAPGMAPMAQPMAPMPPMDSSAPMMPAAAPVMIPIPGTDQSLMNRYDDPLVQARVARSEGKTLDAYRQAHQMRTADDRAIGH